MISIILVHPLFPEPVDATEMRVLEISMKRRIGDLQSHSQSFDINGHGALLSALDALLFTYRSRVKVLSKEAMSGQDHFTYLMY
jgi:hypothetical protein